MNVKCFMLYHEWDEFVRMSIMTYCFQYTYRALLDTLWHFSPSARWMQCRCILRCDRPSRSRLWVCWTAPGCSTASSCGVSCGSASNRSPRSDTRETIWSSTDTKANTSDHLCTLTWWRDKLKDSWKQEVRIVCEDGRKWDTPLLMSVCLRRCVKQAWPMNSFNVYKQKNLRHWPEPDQSASSWTPCPRWAR